MHKSARNAQVLGETDAKKPMPVNIGLSATGRGSGGVPGESLQPERLQVRVGLSRYQGVFLSQHVIAFDADQLALMTVEVNKLRRALQGRKLEEGDWTEIYCRVKNAPDLGWSNLPFRDYVHDGLGVEFKILMRDNPSGSIGRALMHPSATRRINFNSDDPAQHAMEMVISQWASAIDEFELRVRTSSKDNSADLRWGILLWARDLSELLYFEERLVRPKVSDFTAEWYIGNHRGNPTKSLRIFDKASGRVVFSCTGERSGRKLQPYFDVPDVAHGAHIFTTEDANTIPIFVDRDLADRFQKLFPDDHEAGFRELLRRWESDS